MMFQWVLLLNFRPSGLPGSPMTRHMMSHGHYDHFGGMVGFLAANKGKLKNKLPLFVGGEDCFCTRENPSQRARPCALQQSPDERDLDGRSRSAPRGRT